VDPEHDHVEEKRYEDETTSTSKEMPLRDSVIKPGQSKDTDAYLIHSKLLTLTSPSNVKSRLIVENLIVATVKKPVHSQEATTTSACLVKAEMDPPCLRKWPSHHSGSCCGSMRMRCLRSWPPILVTKHDRKKCTGSSEQEK
jgi:hypothetical protein